MIEKESLTTVLSDLRARPMGPDCDPWDPYLTFGFGERPLLTSIEVTVTNLCNLRCEHCAVGDALTEREEARLDIEAITSRLDEVETLLTFSLTGGEPAASRRLVDEVVAPLLRYAKGRGLRTQVNTNLTLPLERYEAFVPWVDVLHISYNYPTAAEFARVAYTHSAHPPARPEALLERMESNARSLADAGVFVSAETILTRATLPHVEAIHRRIVEIGCRRHEIHPLYPSDFAASMSLPTLEELAEGAETLLEVRDPSVWLLFGTFPFFACSPESGHRELYLRAKSAPNTTVRNDPDGRCRLNVSGLTGDVFVQDFADLGPLGNIGASSLNEIWERWLATQTARRIHCACPGAQCLGPNLLVAETYFPEVRWEEQRALVTVA